jgi:hypothetical protein
LRAGGAITRIARVPAEEHEPPTGADCPEYEINYENLDNVDIRFSTFDENYPAWVMMGQVQIPSSHEKNKFFNFGCSPKSLLKHVQCGAVMYLLCY